MDASSLLFVISAASGTGKTSLIAKLLQEDSSLSQIVTHTTRPMRMGEIAGQDYHFVSPEKFQALKEQGALVEHAKVFGLDYGTARTSVETACRGGRDAIMNIDYQGARSFMAAYPVQVVSIFILPPSWEVLEQRLRSRASDSETVIRNRLQAAREEISHHHLFHYCLINDDFDETLSALKSIVSAERSKMFRVKFKNLELFNLLENP